MAFPKPILFVCLFYLSSLSAVSAVILHHQGTVYPVSGYFHLHMEMNVKPFKDHCDELSNLLHQAHFGANNGTIWIQNWMSSTRDILETTCRKINTWPSLVDRNPYSDSSQYSHTSSTTTYFPNKRQQRSISLLIGGAILGFFSHNILQTIFNSNSDSNNHFAALNARVDHVVDTVRSIVRSLATQVSLQHDFNFHIRTAMELGQQILHFSHHVDTIDHGISSLLVHQKVPPSLLPQTELSSIWKSIREVLSSKFPASSLPQEEYVYASTASFAYSPEGILYFAIHIPLLSTPLDLYEYKQFPIIHNSSYPIWALPDTPYLAVNGGEDTYWFPSAHDLAVCSRYHSNFICSISFFHKNVTNNCLAQLYLNNWHTISSTCKLTTDLVDQSLVRTHDRNFLIFSKYPLSYKISCLNGTESSRTWISPINHLFLDNACQLISQVFSIPYDIELAKTFHLKIRFASCPDIFEKPLGTAANYSDWLNTLQSDPVSNVIYHPASLAFLSLVMFTFVLVSTLILYVCYLRKCRMLPKDK